MRNMNLDVTMKVQKSALLAAIKKQREEHAMKYKEAQEGWRQSMMAIAKEILDKGPRLKTFPTALRRINAAPQCHLQEFDDAFSMIEMSTEDTIALTSGDYEQLVLGRWDWHHEWATSNSRYMGGRVGIGTSCLSGITNDELE